MVDKNTQMVNEGLEYLRKAVELSPNDYFNYVILGTSLYKLDRYDEAVANYQEVIHLFPFVNVGYDDLAQTYIKRCMATKEKSYAEKTSKLYDSAVEKMNTVPEKYLKYVNKQIYTSNSPILTFQAGVAEYLLGNYNKGIERFETALTYATEDSFKKEVQAWIIVGDKRVNMPVPSGINADVNTVTKVEKILDEFKEK
jgi:tetratricopeptide (TPR) repeat protein